MITFSKSTNS